MPRNCSPAPRCRIPSRNKTHSEGKLKVRLAVAHLVPVKIASTYLSPDGETDEVAGTARLFARRKQRDSYKDETLKRVYPLTFIGIEIVENFRRLVTTKFSARCKTEDWIKAPDI